MAERLNDEQDKWLESLFESQPVRDGSFSRQVINRVRHRMWVRRLSLPVAFAVGIAVATKPLAQLVSIAPELIGSIPLDLVNLDGLSLGSLPFMSTMIQGAALLVAVLLLGRVLEDA